MYIGAKVVTVGSDVQRAWVQPVDEQTIAQLVVAEMIQSTEIVMIATTAGVTTCSRVRRHHDILHHHTNHDHRHHDGEMEWRHDRWDGLIHTINENDERITPITTTRRYKQQRIILTMIIK